MGEREFQDQLHAWLILLPLLALALPAPWSPFDGAPDTVAIGAGATALAAIPGAVLTALRGRGADAIGLALLLVTLVVAAVSMPSASDTFNAWRSLLGLVGGLAWALNGAALGAAGRRTLQTGLVVLGALLALSIFTSEGRVGSFGNTGDLMEALVPCAVLGGGVFLSSNGAPAFLGFAVLFTTAIAAGVYPVFAALLALAGVTAAAFAGSVLGRSGGEFGRASAARRGRIALIALAVASVPFAIGSLSGGDESPASGEPSEEAATTTGGVPFRLMTWQRVPDLVADAGPTGVGPGQFQAAFPPYRDPAEIELSSFDRREPTPIEVEHAHSEPMTALAEFGWLGGGAFTIFLGLVAFLALRRAGGADPTRRDFALAAIAAVMHALVNAPLLYGVLSSAIAFLVFGVVLSARDDRDVDEVEPEPEERSRLDGPVARRVVPAIPLVLLLLVSPRALSMAKYGRVMAEVETARVVTADGREGLGAGQLLRILDRAAAHEPESVTLIEKRAQLQRRQGAAPNEQRATLERWAARRPHSFAAHLARGNFEASLGDYDAASEAFDRALAVDAGHPALLRNRVRVACDRRDPGAVESALRDLARAGRATPEWLKTMASEELLEGRLDVAKPLVEFAFPDDPVDPTDANAAFRASKEARTERLRDAWLVAFQMAMAQKHLSGNAPDMAATSARQAFQAARPWTTDLGLDNGAIRLRLAAARAAAGDEDRARDRLGEGPIRPHDRSAMSPEERAALDAAGLLAGGISAPD